MSPSKSPYWRANAEKLVNSCGVSAAGNATTFASYLVLSVSCLNGTTTTLRATGSAMSVLFEPLGPVWVGAGEVGRATAGIRPINPAVLVLTRPNGTETGGTSCI